jgi:hypothetical protein
LASKLVRWRRPVEKGAEAGPEGRSELRTIVRGDEVRQAKAGDPDSEVSSCTIGGAGRGKWDNLRQVSGTVNDGEPVSKTM